MENAMTPDQHTFAGSASGTQASIISGLAVNFSGAVVSGTQSRFTVAGSIRIAPPLGSALGVFGADGFSLSIGDDGRRIIALVRSRCDLLVEALAAALPLRYARPPHDPRRELLRERGSDDAFLFDRVRARIPF
jgi:hypothetical protein